MVGLVEMESQLYHTNPKAFKETLSLYFKRYYMKLCIL